MACHSLWFWRHKAVHIEDFVRPFNPNLQVSLRLKEYGDALNMNNMAEMRNRTLGLLSGFLLSQVWSNLMLMVLA